MIRRIFILFILLTGRFVPALFAQGEARFLYIQSDPARLFEVIHVGQTKSASSTGYLILSGLPATSVEFVLRLDGDRVYQVDLSGGDRGLGIRKQGEGWLLVDLKSDQVLEPVLVAGPVALLDTSEASPFARLLSKAVQDPALLLNRRTETKTSVGTAAVNTPVVDSTLVATAVIPVPEETMQRVTKSDTLVREVVAASVANLPVRRMRLNEVAGSWEAIYLIAEGTQVDTVYVQLEVDRVVPPVESVVKSSEVQLPPGCTAELTEPAFLQLRTRMAGAQDEDEMVLLARRAVRTHCLSVSQLRRLSNVFLYDETRYRFYDAVQGHVTDPANFSELAAYLTDPVYQRRFRALLER